MKWLLAAVLSLMFVLSASAQERKVRGVPTGTTRVAVINLGAVFTKYEKTAEYKDEVARTLKGMQEEAKKLTLDITGWQTQLQKNELQEEAKAQLEEKLLNAKRRYEDLDRLAKSRVSKTQEQILGKMWGDIHDAVKIYAAKHKIELVIAYGEQVKKDDSISFPEIDRKMRPLFARAER